MELTEMKTLVYELVNELVNRCFITPLYRGSSKVERAVDNRLMAVRFCLSVIIHSQERKLQRVRQCRGDLRECCDQHNHHDQRDLLDRQDSYRHHQQQNQQDQHQTQMMLAPDSMGIGVFSNVLRFERRVPGAKPGFPELWLWSKGKTGGCELPNAVSRSASHPICAFSQVVRRQFATLVCGSANLPSRSIYFYPHHI
jgi:hypothetical protein